MPSVPSLAPMASENVSHDMFTKDEKIRVQFTVDSMDSAGTN